jgi:hypothetical protein
MSEAFIRRLRRLVDEKRRLDHEANNGPLWLRIGLLGRAARDGFRGLSWSKHVSRSNRGELASTEPPALAEFIVALFAKAKQHKALLGDLEEKFRAALIGGCSLPRARRLYWAETLRSVCPLAWEKLKGIGFFGLIVAAARKLLG